jgi:PAS domain S-box-containing protein
MSLPDNDSPLRVAAEAQLAATPGETSARSMADLLHELQVHQIELEMQNETLRKAEFALAESRDRYLDLYEFAPVGYLTLSSECVIEAINLTGAKLLGAERNALLRYRFAAFIVPEDRDRWLRRFQQIKARGEAASVELAMQRGDGSVFQAQFDCVPQKGMRSDIPGVGTGGTTLRVSFSDITHRIEAEQRLKGMSLRLLGAQEEARRLLANELHNRTSANLAALGVNLDVADIALNSCDWQEISARMSDNRALVQDTQSSIREICAELRPPALDYAGLIPAIESYANQFARRTGIKVELDCKGAAMKLPDHIESTLFRIAQEALTNIAKHAQARNVQVQLCLESPPLCLNVVDDGQGFDPGALHATQGLGIINMREMAEFAGGSFNLDSKPGGGTRIHVELAIQKEEA